MVNRLSGCDSQLCFRLHIISILYSENYIVFDELTKFVNFDSHYNRINDFIKFIKYRYVGLFFFSYVPWYFYISCSISVFIIICNCIYYSVWYLEAAGFGFFYTFFNFIVSHLRILLEISPVKHTGHTMS